MKAAPDQDNWRRKFAKSGYFVCALLFHLILFLMLATCVVFRASVQDQPANFVKINLPPPPLALPAAAGGDAVNALEPSLQTTPPPTAPSVLTSVSSTAFTVKAVNVSLPNFPASISTPTGMGFFATRIPPSLVIG